MSQQILQALQGGEENVYAELVPINDLLSETLGETYILSFSYYEIEDLGQAASWAAHIVLPNFSILGPDSQIMFFQYSVLAIWQLKV